MSGLSEIINYRYYLLTIITAIGDGAFVVSLKGEISAR